MDLTSLPAMSRTGLVHLVIIVSQLLLLASGQNDLQQQPPSQSSYAPALQVTSLDGYIRENQAAGALVRIAPADSSQPLQIRLTDQDLQPGQPDVVYQYKVSGPAAQLFGIDQRGILYQNVDILDADPPNLDQYELTIEAIETNTEPIRTSGPLTLQIHIVDTNDNVPAFSSRLFTASVAATGPPREVLKLAAVDNDSGELGSLTYNIQSVTNGGQNSFIYNDSTNSLLAFGNLLPNEQYQVLLRATDGGGQVGQTVVLVETLPVTRQTTDAPFAQPPLQLQDWGFLSIEDVPEFAASVSENTAPSTVVMSLGGGFPAGTVRYSIVAGNEENKFTINRQTGVLSTLAAFDRETTAFYRLVIEATPLDGAQPQRTVVVVGVDDVNDNAPRFIGPRPITFEVRAGLASEVIGRLILEDLDADVNGRVSLQIQPPNELFTIQQSGVLLTTGPLPNEPRLYQLNVLAIDGGNPPLQSTTIVQINVIPDPNQQTTSVSRQPQTSTTQFTRPSTTTTTTTRTASTSGTTRQFTFTTTSQTTTTPRLPPIFVQSEFVVDIDENTAPTNILTLVAQYPDGQPGAIEYILLDGDQDLFQLDSRSGVLSTRVQLDAEDNQRYQVIVATQQTAESSQPFTEQNAAVIQINVVDVNDFIPTFTEREYSITVADYTQPGTAVFQVDATDNDVSAQNNQITYELSGTGGAADYFRIDRATGMLSVNGDLSEVSGQILQLFVQASDSGVSPQTSRAAIALEVQPTVTSVLPGSDSTLTPIAEQIQFSMRQFTGSVSENAIPPHTIITIPVLNQPFDRNTVRCDVVSGNYGDAFSLSPTRDGNCELRSVIQLDRESIDGYLLNVTVSAMEFADYATVRISVLDANDNKPAFTYNNDLGLEQYFGGISATADELTPILTVNASDADLDYSGVVSYNFDALSSDSQYFSVDGRTGVVRNQRAMNSIAQDYFELGVVAQDTPRRGQELKNRATIVINKIRDDNRFVVSAEGILPNQMENYIQDVKRKMRLYMSDCRLILVENSFTSRNLQEQGKPGTDIVLFAINPTTRQICKRTQYDTLFRNATVAQLRGDMSSWFNLVSVGAADASRLAQLEAEGATVQSAGYDGSWSTLAIAFIVMAVLVAIGACCAICAICCFWNKYKAKKDTASTMPATFYGPTPLYMPPSEKMYETQMLEMAMTDDEGRMIGGDRGGDDYAVDDSIYTVTAPNGLETPPVHGRSPVVIPPPDYPNAPRQPSKPAPGRPNSHQQKSIH